MVDHTDTGGSGDDYAGDGSPILYLAIDMPGGTKCARSVKAGCRASITSNDINDLEDGCAGDGSPITAVRCYYETQDPDATGWLGIEYSVANVGEGFLADMIDPTTRADAGTTTLATAGRCRRSAPGWLDCKELV